MIVSHKSLSIFLRQNKGVWVGKCVTLEGKHSSTRVSSDGDFIEDTGDRAGDDGGALNRLHHLEKMWKCKKFYYPFLKIF